MWPGALARTRARLFGLSSHQNYEANKHFFFIHYPACEKEPMLLLPTNAPQGTSLLSNQLKTALLTVLLNMNCIHYVSPNILFHCLFFIVEQVPCSKM
jgi:hypothetical protein